MSSRAWAATVLLTCLAGAVASGIFGAGSTAGVFVAGIALSLCWLIFDPWLRRHLPFRPKQPPAPDLKADADLRRRCRQLGQQIAFFAANRKKDDPAHVPHWYGLPDDATEEQRNQAFERSSKIIIQYMNETMAQYSVQFMGPALALFDELLARGWIGGAERWRFETPTNPTGVEAIARTLQRIGDA